MITHHKVLPGLLVALLIIELIIVHLEVFCSEDTPAAELDRMQ